MNLSLRCFLPLFAVLLLSLASLTHARPVGIPRIINVPSATYPTIQSGVDAASLYNGDTVLVADGTYSGPGNRDIDFNGKNITVTSQNGPTKTIIDCGGYASTDGSGNHRGFYIHSGETKATISGFTVKNGYETYIPKTFNSFSDGIGGGGVCIDNENKGEVTITNCIISDNTATDGGGICNYNNFSGSLVLESGTIALTRCVVIRNHALSGGGIYNDNFNGTVVQSDCTIAGNTANNGGGIENDNFGSSKTTQTNCVIANNTAHNNGGGLYNSYQNYSIPAMLINCIVCDNSASIGGGIYNWNYNGGSIVALINDIVYVNQGGEFVNSFQTPLVSSSDIQGGYPGTGNIDKDPLFVNAAAGDLHLKPGSPCLGAGTPDGAPATDLDGNPRPNPPSMGAYEVGPGEVSEDPGKLHLKADGINGDAAGIVCDNLSGMDDATKDKLTLNLPDFPDATNLTGTVTATGANTNDTGEVRTVGTATYYFPPDEYNENQVPQDVTKDITKSATRTVTLTLHFKSGGKQHVITKAVILARPPVVLVHGINSNPTKWLPLSTTITASGIRVPFVAVDHSQNMGGNGPVEDAARLLSHQIFTTLGQVHGGEPIQDGTSTTTFNRFDDYDQIKLADKRVDVLGWSYGGVITRWYIAANDSGAGVFYNHDIRKVITLGSMWRGVPIANFVNEAYAQSNNGIALGDAPFTIDNVTSLSLVERNLAEALLKIIKHTSFKKVSDLLDFINNVNAVRTQAPSIDVIAVNSPKMSKLVYPDGVHALPFSSDIAYGSVAGEDNSYPVSIPNNPLDITGTLRFDLYTLLDEGMTAGNPTWFPYMGLERKGDFSNSNYSDGIVPIWSSAIPGSYKIAPTTHKEYVQDPDTINYITQWLNNASLPMGSALNTIWNDPMLNKVQSGDGTKTWSFRTGEMAPHAENDLYPQIGGVGRINPLALKEINTATYTSLGPNQVTIKWLTATDMNSTADLYTKTFFGYQSAGHYQNVTPVKLHTVTFSGLQPGTDYYCQVASSLFNPPDADISVQSPMLRFHTPATSKPILALSVLDRTPSQGKFTLKVTNSGSAAVGFKITDLNFSVPGYSFTSADSGDIGPSGTRYIVVYYNVGTAAARLLCRVNYSYHDTNNQNITGNTAWLRLK